MPDVNRRSFLAILAGALACKPAELARAADQVAHADRSPIIPEWWKTYWTITHDFVFRPGESKWEEAFFPPIPPNFAIRHVGVVVEASAKLVDIVDVYEKATVSILADGLESVRAPLWSTPPFFAGLNPYAPGVFARDPVPLWPQLKPKKDFRIRMVCDRLNTSGIVRVQSRLDGCFIEAGDMWASAARLDDKPAERK